MAVAVQRLMSHGRALQITMGPLCRRPFSSSSDSLMEVTPGEIGKASGIPEEHLRRRVKKRHNLLLKTLWTERATVTFRNVWVATSPARSLTTATSTDTESRTQKLERISDELINLTKLERYDFSILWRLKMGLNRYGPAVSAPSSGAAVDGSRSGATEAKATEKTAFDIKLEKYDAAAKIKIIKEVRAFTDLGLKEAKDLVEKVPCVLKKGLTKEEANPIVDKLKELGATVVLE